MKTKYIFFIALFAVILGLTGCGSSSDKDADASAKATASDKSYTVKHAMGTTTVKGTPKRIVVLTNEGTEALLAMGVKPVGAVQSWLGNPWYDHIKDKMDGVKVVGTESSVNLEAIAKLHPDLIIGNKMRQEKQYDKLKAIAPTIFSDELRGDWQENFKLYAKAINKEDKGQDVLKQFNDKVKSIHDKLADQNKLNAKISLVRFMAGQARIYHKDTFAGVILKEIGLQRPASQDKNDFAALNATEEMIPQMDGDYIFYFTYAPSGDNGQAQKEENNFTNNKLWKNLKGVKDGHVYKVSDAIWNTAGGVIAANQMLDELEKDMLSSN
ncbi:iron siderophore-binding protein [Pullulanibacillus camelliae]|uniref:Iron siderophore-binding protein n=1 Tax=Pullulanibacillus camelliae TaxID=1707096 RepID=A0A8J3DWI5_9BACL|nr:iron-siderophore ABC transporter substrate-binding protein [Pullulanibacillus camelliae]GGE49690.1 iron siderophore-binding protein [Pullulanibacillus camelliae]